MVKVGIQSSITLCYGSVHDTTHTMDIYVPFEKL